MKKLFGVLLSFVLILSLAGTAAAAPVSAEEIVIADQTVSNTVNAAADPEAVADPEVSDPETVVSDPESTDPGTDVQDQDLLSGTEDLSEETERPDEPVEEVVELELMQEGGLPAEEPVAEELVAENGLSFEEAVETAVECREESIDISGYELTAEEAAAAVAEVINNNPRYFFLSGEDVPVLLDPETGTVSEIGLVYTMDEAEISANNRIIDDELAKIAAFADAAPDGELDRVLAIHEYFCLNYCYDNVPEGEDPETYPHIFDVPGLFLYKQGVCQAFALAFSLVTDEMGIESGYASGYPEAGKDGHAWNYVVVDGQWYGIDLTWGGQSCMAGYVSRTYLLKSEDHFGHSRYEQYHYTTTGGDAVDTTYNSFWWNGISANTAVYPVNGSWYYLENFGNSSAPDYRIMRSPSAYSVDDAEAVFTSTEEVTVGPVMAYYDGKICFSGKGPEDTAFCNLYSMDPDGTEVTLAYSEPDGKKIAAFGSLYENLYYGTRTTSEGSNYLYYNIPVDLSGGQIVYVSDVSVSPSEVLLTGDSVQLAAEVTPATATDPTVYWTSSDNSIAQVDENGLVTPVGGGTAQITAVTRNGNHRASAEVTVPQAEDLGAYSVFLSPETETEGTLFWTPAENASSYLVYEIIDDGNSQTGYQSNDYVLIAETEGYSLDVSRSDPDEEAFYTVVAVNESGRGKSVDASLKRSPCVIWRSGDHTVKTVTCEQGTAGFNLTVAGEKVSPLSAYAVKVTFEGIEEADAYRIHKITTDEDRNMMPGKAAYYSNSASTSRKLTIEPGYGYFFFLESFSGGSSISNVSRPVYIYIPKEGLRLNEKTAALYCGVPYAFRVFNVADEEELDPASVRWTTTGSSVVTVNNGVATGVSCGSKLVCTYTQDRQYGASCEVTVYPSVLLDTGTLDLLPGQTGQLSAQILPESSAGESLIWASSDETVATVSETGEVTAVNSGTAVISVTVENGGYTAESTVNVPVPVSGLTLNKTKINAVKDGKYAIKAIVSPEDATDKNVTWTSSNPEVAKVSSKGIVTALKKGAATITATTNDGGFTASCKVTVRVPVSRVKLYQTDLTLAKSSTYQLTWRVYPTNASNQNVTFESSDPTVAKVSSGGLVTARNVGSAVITIRTKDGNFTANCKITVTIPVTRVKLYSAELVLAKGKTKTLAYKVYPVNATNREVAWTSSDPTVAAVSSTGKVTAKKAGTAVITVTTKDGNHTANCKVTVTK